MDACPLSLTDEFERHRRFARRDTRCSLLPCRCHWGITTYQNVKLVGKREARSSASSWKSGSSFRPLRATPARWCYRIPRAQTAEVAAPANASAPAISHQPGIASKFGTPTSTSSGQFSYLLDDYVYTPSGVSQSAGAVATTAPVSTNPEVNLLGSNLTLTNLSVSVLNPQMTSFTDAIIDDQVNADAYMVPSDMELLEGELGERVTLPVTLWNTNAFNPTTQNQAPPPQHGLGGRHTVSNRGQSFKAIPDVNARGAEGIEFSEPPAAAPGQGPQSQSGPQPEKAPAQPGATPQPVAPKGGQAAPEIKKIPQPAPNPDQAAPKGSQPGQAPNGGQSPAQGANPGQPVPTSPNPVGNPAPGKTTDPDTSQSLSVMFGTAILAAGGHRLVMRQQDRSQGRNIPRWSGAERPNRHKIVPS